MAARLESGVMQANGEIKAEPMMDVEYVANSIVHIANLPTSVTVDEFRILYVLTNELIINGTHTFVSSAQRGCHLREEDDMQCKREIVTEQKLYPYNRSKHTAISDFCYLHYLHQRHSLNGSCHENLSVSSDVFAACFLSNHRTLMNWTLNFQSRCQIQSLTRSPIQSWSHCC